MRRLLFIFLLVFLPLQSIWAAASPYCSHEASPEAVHFGHHEHEHDHAAVADAPSDAVAEHDGPTPPSTTSAGADLDCHVCHGAGSAVCMQAGGPSQWMANAHPLPRVQPALTAPCPYRPERPNWQPLA